MFNVSNQNQYFIHHQIISLSIYLNVVILKVYRGKTVLNKSGKENKIKKKISYIRKTKKFQININICKHDYNE